MSEREKMKACVWLIEHNGRKWRHLLHMTQGRFNDGMSGGEIHIILSGYEPIEILCDLLYCHWYAIDSPTLFK